MAEQNEEQKTIAEKVVKKFDKLKGMRVNWDTHWERVAELVLPRKDNIFQNSNPGGNKNVIQLFDSTAIHSNELLGSALHGTLTSPTGIWFGLTTGDRLLDDEDAVREWLDDSVKRMIRVLNNSNFQTEIHETYLDLGCFGTNSLRMEEDDDSVIRFHSRPIYEHFISEDNTGRIDTVYREYEYTLRQVLQAFGEEVFNDQMMRQLEADPMKKEKIIHAVEPREDVKRSKKGKPSNMPWASFHVMQSNRVLLASSGFREFPYAVPRWTKISSEIYGRSPAMKCLPDIRMVNKMMEVTIRAAQKVVDPPLISPDDGVLLPIRTAPGSINYKRAGSKDTLEPLLTGGRVDLGAALIEQVQDQIRKCFFIDQLQLVQADRMTATEVIQRRDEQLRLLSPILGRLHSELLKPVIERTFAIMFRKQLLLDPPDLLQGVDLDIQFVSQIAKAQRATETEDFQRALGVVAPVMEIQPDVADNIDGDEVVRFAADVFSLPPELIRNSEEVAAIRQGRAQAEAEAAEEAEAAASAENIQKAGPVLSNAREKGQI